MPAPKATGAQVAEELINGSKPWPQHFLSITNVTRRGESLWQFNFTYSYGRSRGRRCLGCSGKEYDNVLWYRNELALRHELLTPIQVGLRVSRALFGCDLVRDGVGGAADVAHVALVLVAQVSILVGQVAERGGIREVCGNEKHFLQAKKMSGEIHGVGQRVVQLLRDKLKVAVAPA